MSSFTNTIKEKDQLRVYNLYDDYTRENLTMINLSEKVPFIFDSTRMAKQILIDYLERRDKLRRIAITNNGEKDFWSVIEKSMKEGHYLLVEKVDERVYNQLKNIIQRNFLIERGKTYVQIENETKEVNEKFKLFLLKDLNDSPIDTVFFMETDIINFNLNLTQMKYILWKELICYKERQLWDNQNNVKTEFFNLKLKCLEIEEKLLNTIQAFDYTGNVEKNSFNTQNLDKFKNENDYHNLNANSIKNLEEKRLDIKIDVSIYEKLCEDSSKIFKKLIKFSNINKLFNIHIYNFSKVVNNFYDEK